MDSNQILTITVFVIVITIVGTIALAVVGYLAFRLRERKHPSRPSIDQTMTRPYFFERVRIPSARDTAETPALPAESDAAGSGDVDEPAPATEEPQPPA